METIECPRCGWSATVEDFDGLGACEGNVFCISCHCEFSCSTGVVHSPLDCDECMEARNAQV